MYSLLGEGTTWGNWPSSSGSGHDTDSGHLFPKGMCFSSDVAVEIVVAAGGWVGNGKGGGRLLLREEGGGVRFSATALPKMSSSYCFHHREAAYSLLLSFPSQVFQDSFILFILVRRVASDPSLSVHKCRLCGRMRASFRKEHPVHLSMKTVREGDTHLYFGLQKTWLYHLHGQTLSSNVLETEGKPFFILAAGGWAVKFPVERWISRNTRLAHNPSQTVALLYHHLLPSSFPWVI